MIACNQRLKNAATAVEDLHNMTPVLGSTSFQSCLLRRVKYVAASHVLVSIDATMSALLMLK
jgi:hypothetical protein